MSDTWDIIETDLENLKDKIREGHMTYEEMWDTLVYKYGGVVKKIVETTDKPIDSIYLGILLASGEYDLAERSIRDMDMSQLREAADYLEPGLNIPVSFLYRFTDLPQDKQVLILDLLLESLETPIYYLLTDTEFGAFKKKTIKVKSPISWYYKPTGLNIEGTEMWRNTVDNKPDLSINEWLDVLDRTLFTDPVTYLLGLYSIADSADNMDLVYPYLARYIETYGEIGYNNISNCLLCKILKHGVDNTTPFPVVLIHDMNAEKVSGYLEVGDIKEYIPYGSTRDLYCTNQQ